MYQIVYRKNEKFIKEKGTIIEYISEIHLDKNIDKETMDFLDCLENQVVENKRLEDLYIYDNIPLYYFYKPSLYDKLKEIIYYISIMQFIINKYGINLEVVCDSKLYKDITVNVLHINNVKLINHEQNKTHKTDIKFNLLLIKRVILGLANLIKFRLTKKKSNFIVLSQSSSVNPVNINGETHYRDTIYGETIPNLKKKHNVLNLQNLTTRTSIYNSKLYEEEIVPFEFFKLYKLFKWKKLIRRNEIINNLSLLKEFNYNYNNTDLKEVLSEHIFKSIEEHYLSYLKEIVTSRFLLNKYKIKGCIAVDEADRARCFITSANLLGIETFAIQHGIITELSAAYMIKSNNKDKLVPNITFVWGDKYKKVLLNNTKVYNEKNVKVVGQIRTDYIKEYLKTHNNDEEFTILYATQYPEDILKPATMILFEALNKINFQYKLIIKLHPLDKQEDYYKSQIIKYGLKNVFLNKESDLYDFINQSNIIISAFSSVIAEGIIFNKPATCILLPNYYDAGGFVKDGIAYGVETSEELASLLNKVHITKNIEGLKIKEYLRENFYEIDGYVYKRIVNYIEERV